MKKSGLAYPDIARILGTGLISTGGGLLLFVLITVVWGDPFTRITEASAQKDLRKQLSFNPDTAALAETPTLDARTTRIAARQYRKSLKDGQVAGQLKIPRIGLRKYVVRGASPGPLARGPGLYDVPRTFPGAGLPVAIAGHRTTHGAPFLNIDKLRPGDQIILDMPYGRFTYRVTKTRIISPRDWSIIKVGAAERSAATARQMQTARQCPQGTCEHLVLTACHPKYSAAKRIAVFARPFKVELRQGGAA